MSNTHSIDLATYLFARLAQLGITSLHGVPGDYNLTALDYLPAAGIKWVGNCNELNAGYAADGYARIKGMGAVTTVFGVGELSAINAIAGSFAEKVPVVHIVGMPSTKSQRDGMLMHHSLGNGDFRVFADMAARVSVAQANLDNVTTAAEDIDRVLRECWLHKRPVYTQLPTDMVTQKVDASRLKKPIDMTMPKPSAQLEEAVVEAILTKLDAAKRPMIIVDGGAQRHRVSLAMCCSMEDACANMSSRCCQKSTA